MLYFVVFTLLAASALAENQPLYTFSVPVGPGHGTAYVTRGQGRIDAVRAWEYTRTSYYYRYCSFYRRQTTHIYGIQFSYDGTWSPIVGHGTGRRMEMKLCDGEAIVQVSGTYDNYVNSLVFITNKGRSLYVGERAGHSFNMYGHSITAELSFVSGRYSGYLTSIGTHWIVHHANSW